MSALVCADAHELTDLPLPSIRCFGLSEDATLHSVHRDTSLAARQRELWSFEAGIYLVYKVLRDFAVGPQRKLLRLNVVVTLETVVLLPSRCTSWSSVAVFVLVVLHSVLESKTLSPFILTASIQTVVQTSFGIRI